MSNHGHIPVKRLWGTVPVEADGSAHFRVPAQVPIYFMAVDAQGRAHFTGYTLSTEASLPVTVGPEDTRLLHRYLDLRRRPLVDAMRMRSMLVRSLARAHGARHWVRHRRRDRCSRFQSSRQVGGLPRGGRRS